MSKTSTDSNVVIARGLTKRFGNFTAVDGIDFDVRRGEIFGFLGPNGSGKTTTIRMMLGLLPPTSGTLDVLGVSVTKHTRELRSHIGYMSQRFTLYNDLTVLENLQFHGRAYGVTNSQLRERIQTALKMANLEGREHTRTRDLSGGWRQRLALGAAILHQPELIFLDEPTAGVDPISRRAFWDLLYGLIAEGITVFVTTHYMDEAERCHRLAFIQRGHLIAAGTPDEIKQVTMHGQVLEIASSDAAQAVKALRAAREAGRLAFDEVALYGSLVHVVAPEIDRRREVISNELQQAGIRVDHISVIAPSLEDVFIASMK
jgi:ABC-2 type transport system ATP-binding protein